jgi:hypothetical protein
MVYLIHMSDTDFYKVGYTGGPVEERLATLQTGNPLHLTVLAVLGEGTLADEQQIHTRLSAYRTSGGDEWFKLTEDQAIQLTQEWSHCDVTPEWTGCYRAEGQAGRLHAYDVRPICRRQQDTVARRIQNVFHAGQEDAVHAGHQPVFFPVRQKHNQRG